MNETYITVTGNLTADPELRFTPSGVPVVSFTVATTRRVYNKDRSEWEDADTTFYACKAWRQMGENAAESLVKGARVVVHGTLAVRTYERKDGTKGTAVEINVTDVGPSLQRATAQVTRNPRQGQQDQQPRREQPHGGQRDPWADEPPF